MAMPTMDPNRKGFEATLLKPNTWMITSAHGCTSYLVVGDNFGVMVDTGESTEDIHAFVTTLTDKPVEIVLNTHGHFDHTGGNGFFKVALMGKLAAEIAKVPNGDYCDEHLAEYPLDYPIVVIDHGFQIDLGNRVLEAFKIDGHSPDSIAYLDHKERIVFGGDAVTQMVPMMYKRADPQPSMILYVQSLARLMARREEFDYLCCGHGNELKSASLVDDCMIAGIRAMKGEVDERPQRPQRPSAPAGGPGGPKKHQAPDANIPPEMRGFIHYGDVNMMFHKGYIRDTTRYNIVEGT